MPQPAQFTLTIAEMLEESAARAGFEARSGYDIRSARRSLNLIQAEWSNRGLNLWTVVEGSLGLTPNVAKYPLPADTIDLLDVTVNDGSGYGADYSMTRISQTTWMQIVDKTMQGRPVQYMVQRQNPPILVVWPLPQTSGYSLKWWRLQRMFDATASDTTTDIPSRFLEPMVAGLAFHLAMKSMDPAIRAGAPMLKMYYEEQLKLAQDEDRDRASIRLVPRTRYT